MTNKHRWVLPLFLIFASGACFAQSTNSGDIRGTVTDPSGALIPGVTVTVVNVDTGVSKSFTTNQSGLYDTDSIVTGQYTVTFVKDGFEKLVRGPVTLQIGFTAVEWRGEGSARRPGNHRSDDRCGPACRLRPANRALRSRRCPAVAWSRRWLSDVENFTDSA